MPTIKRADRDAMRNATMGCWWPSRASPGAPCWSGIRNELGYLAVTAEERITFTGVAETPSPQELARLADIAQGQIV